MDMSGKVWPLVSAILPRVASGSGKPLLFTASKCASSHCSSAEQSSWQH